MLYGQIQTRAEGESLYVRYNTDGNVVRDRSLFIPRVGAEEKLF